jgi:hypothetical protein
LIFLGSPHSSGHDSGLFMIIPLTLLLCLFILRLAGYSVDYLFQQLLLLCLFRLLLASSIPRVSSLC